MLIGYSKLLALKDLLYYSRSFLLLRAIATSFVDLRHVVFLKDIEKEAHYSHTFIGVSSRNQIQDLDSHLIFAPLEITILEVYT